MEQYVFSADLLNKFSQLTPWIQGLISLTVCLMIVGIAYFFKESVAAVMKPFVKNISSSVENESKEEKPEWKDKYYRGE